MNKREAVALASYRMERSRESLRAAQIMFENNMLTFSMNRIYYAMFYGVQALLATREVSISKHGQVKAYFNREMVKTGVFPTAMGQLYNKAFEYRQKFDYWTFPPLITRWSCNTWKKRERDFIDRIEAYLGKA